LTNRDAEIPKAAEDLPVLEAASRSFSGEDRTAVAIQKLGWALTLVVAAQFVLQLDFSIVNVALPTIQQQLTRAVQQLKQVVTTLKMLPVFESVSIPFHSQFIDEEGQMQANEVMEVASDAMLSELVRTEAALRPLRGEARNDERPMTP